MRISGGTLKGRNIGTRKAFLVKAEGCDLRPTPAKVREAVFNIIRGVLEGASFLDLYAGSGAVGIEALSRGAGKVVFVEEDAGRLKMIKESVERFGFLEKATTVRGSVKDFLKKDDERYDIIFLDPPYGSGEAMEAVALIDRLGRLADGGLVIAEHSSRTALAENAGDLYLKKKYKYGDTSLSLYIKEKL